MNEYSRFIQEHLDKRGWRASEIERRGGPSRQVVSKILNDARPVLVDRPKQETIEGLARVFGVPVEAVLVRVAMAMGFPVTVAEADLSAVSNDDLLSEVRNRMKEVVGNGYHPAPIAEAVPAGGEVKQGDVGLAAKKAHPYIAHDDIEHDF